MDKAGLACGRERQGLAMKRIFLSLGSLMVSAAILLAGGGLHGTLISVRANLEGFALVSIGVIMAGYYAGFILGCVATPEMVRRVGHIRVFAALAALVAASSLVFPIEPYAPLWFALRCVVGFSFAGLYMIVESWINERSTNENRGQVLAIYRFVDLGAMTVGQYMLLLADPGGFVLFSLVAILVALSLVPVSLTRIEVPAPPSHARLDLKRLWRVSPLAVAGCAAVGMSNSAFWAISPVFVQDLGYGAAMVANFMGMTIVVGALAQWPVGLLSDVIDRRSVLLIVSLGAALAGAAIALTADAGVWWLLAGAGAYGIFGMSLFGLCAAHANDHAEPEDFVSVSGGLLLVYGAGSVIGPLVAPLAMTAFGPAALFSYTALVHAGLFVFGLWRVTRRSRVPSQQQEQYVPLAKPSTPAVFEFDPRSPD